MAGNVGAADATALAINATTIDTQADAATAVTTVATPSPRSARCRVRSVTLENRLSYAINLAQSQIVNTRAAESRIRDANIAEESANLTRFNILNQSGHRGPGAGQPVDVGGSVAPAVIRVRLAGTVAPRGPSRRFLRCSPARRLARPRRFPGGATRIQVSPPASDYSGEGPRPTSISAGSKGARHELANHAERLQQHRLQPGPDRPDGSGADSGHPADDAADRAQQPEDVLHDVRLEAGRPRERGRRAHRRQRLRRPQRDRLRSDRRHRPGRRHDAARQLRDRRVAAWPGPR